jgi:hypothetical protein
MAISVKVAADVEWNTTTFPFACAIARVWKTPTHRDRDGERRNRRQEHGQKHSQCSQWQIDHWLRLCRMGAASIRVKRFESTIKQFTQVNYVPFHRVNIGSVLFGTRCQQLVRYTPCQHESLPRIDTSDVDQWVLRAVECHRTRPITTRIVVWSTKAYREGRSLVGGNNAH